MANSATGSHQVMYAIVNSTGNEEKVVEKLGTAEEAYRRMLEWIDYAEQSEGKKAAEVLLGTLRVETLH